ncbi:hypothetical protein LXL04_001827 [Taraxacum kok-saghyz]
MAKRAVIDNLDFKDDWDIVSADVSDRANARQQSSFDKLSCYITSRDSIVDLDNGGLQKSFADVKTSASGKTWINVYGREDPFPSISPNFSYIAKTCNNVMHSFVFMDAFRFHGFFRKLGTADVWTTSSSAELCRCGPQTADELSSKVIIRNDWDETLKPIREGGPNVTTKTYAVCGPHLQPSAAEDVDQTSAVCKKKTKRTKYIHTCSVSAKVKEQHYQSRPSLSSHLKFKNPDHHLHRCKQA